MTFFTLCCLKLFEMEFAILIKFEFAINFMRFFWFVFFFPVQPTIVIPNQLVGSPLGKEVHLECYAEAYPKTINYWVKNRGEILLEG